MGGRYNVDMYFRKAFHQALDLQRITMGKLQLWLDERKLYVTHLAKLSAQDCERKAAAHILRLLAEAEDEDSEESDSAGGDVRAEQQQLAASLCKHMELFKEEVDASRRR